MPKILGIQSGAIGELKIQPTGFWILLSGKMKTEEEVEFALENFFAIQHIILNFLWNTDNTYSVHKLLIVEYEQFQQPACMSF